MLRARRNARRGVEMLVRDVQAGRHVDPPPRPRPDPQGLGARGWPRATLPARAYWDGGESTGDPDLDQAVRAYVQQELAARAAESPDRAGGGRERRQRRRPGRPAAEPRGRAVRPRRRAARRHGAAGARRERRLQPEDFYRDGHGRMFDGDARAAHGGRAGRRADAGRAPEAGRGARGSGSARRRAAIDLLAGSVPAVGNVPPVRADRPQERDATATA